MATTNVMSLNVRGLNNHQKRHTLYRWFKENNPNIILLQETFCKKELEDLNNKLWQTIFCPTDSPQSRGVAIALNKNQKFEIMNIHRKNDARAILINAIIEET